MKLRVAVLQGGRSGEHEISLRSARSIMEAMDASRYEVIHLHFMTTLTRSGWELEWLKRMGRKVVVHWRGCEIRNRERNMTLHPEFNLCEGCEYNPRLGGQPGGTSAGLGWLKTLARQTSQQ